MKKHEESHIADMLAKNKDIAKGLPKDLVVHWTDREEWYTSEVKAHKVELACLQAAVALGKLTQPCLKQAQRRIALTNQKIASYQKDLDAVNEYNNPPYNDPSPKGVDEYNRKLEDYYKKDPAENPIIPRDPLLNPDSYLPKATSLLPKTP